MLKLIIKLGITGTTVFVLGLGITTAFSSPFIKAHNPEVGGSAAGDTVPGPPLLAPPDNEVEYQPRLAGKSIDKPDQRPVAQLATHPIEPDGTVEVYFPPVQPVGEQDISYTILSSIRYKGKDNQTVLVTTAQPSEKAAQEYVLYGDTTLDLGDTRVGWSSLSGDQNVPNQIVFFEGNLIVTIASNIPISTLTRLVPQIQVK